MTDAKYQQIADRLRDQITSGALKPGQRLPSEPDLVRDFRSSRNTVRLALALLTNQGLVVTRQGLGTFVQEPVRPFTALLSRAPGVPTGHHATAALPVSGSADGEPETVRFLVEQVSASASVAAKLELQRGDPVVIRRTLQRLDGAPWLMINSYFPMDLASGTPLEQAACIEDGSIKLLADLGYAQAGFVDEIGARMPDAREYDFFRLSSGTPVIVVNRTSYSQERPIRLSRYVYRGDRVRLAHEVGVIPARYRSG
ncbi:MAG TPA: GntR family transcriptional regulator [Streptosporangiaceae bacterium]|nr:GntR family transcriptional regulator [Streptosporangiaceae bacterium]